MLKLLLLIVFAATCYLSFVSGKRKYESKCAEIDEACNPLLPKRFAVKCCKGLECENTSSIEGDDGVCVKEKVKNNAKKLNSDSKKKKNTKKNKTKNNEPKEDKEDE